MPVYRAREGKRGSVLEIVGTEANLAMAEYVHAFMMHTAEELWAAHKRARGISGDVALLGSCTQIFARTAASAASPAAPSLLLPLSKMPIASLPTDAAALSNSGSIAGREKCSALSRDNAIVWSRSISIW